MTLLELQQRRDLILDQMSQPQAMNSGQDGLTNRSLRDLQSALATLDAEIKRMEGTSSGAIGRLYTGEGL